jgi:hypothetical protein
MGNRGNEKTDSRSAPPAGAFSRLQEPLSGDAMIMRATGPIAGSRPAAPVLGRPAAAPRRPRIALGWGLRAPAGRLEAAVGLARAQAASGGLGAAPPPPMPPPPGGRSIGLKRSVWTFIDVVAILGSVGGALAALLGWASMSYALFLPLVLPVVSLVAALKREGLIAEVRVLRP